MQTPYLKTILSLLFPTILFFTCTSQQYFANNLPPSQIHFGEGGGFTGAVEEFCLLENGQFFVKKNFVENFVALKNVKKKVAKNKFSTCQKMNIEQIKMNNPGDKYYFISYHTDKIEHKITWGRKMDEVPLEVINLYESLKLLTKD